MKAIVYLGWYRETSVKVDITKEDVKRGYVFVPCFECEGTGVWNYYPDDYFPNGYIPTKKELRCTTCKGTGKVLINC
jgi:DnaJ-class molecular chaperone